MRAITSDSFLEELSRDAGMIVRRPAAAFVAEDDKEVLSVLEFAELRGLPVTARGGGTSIPSQAVGSGVILLQERNRIVLRKGSVECGPSVVKAEFNRRLDQAGEWMPADPSSYLTCTLGGMVANNSSGARTFKYGSTIDYVTELDVVLPKSGLKTLKPMPLEEAVHADATTRQVAELLLENRKSIEEERPAVTKNSSGYRLERAVHDGFFDLPKLIVGSEGTLGVITRIVLKTQSKPRSRALLVVETSLDELDKVASLLRAMHPSALELVDKSVFMLAGKEDRLGGLSRKEEEYLVFCEFDGSNDDEVAKALGRASESEIAGYEPLAITDPGRISAVWEVRNETLTLATEIRKDGKILVPGVEDLVVPPERLGELVALLREQFEGRGLTYISYGHAGDANLHMRPFLDPGSSSDRTVLREIMEDCFERVWKLKGSMSGEHGDGLLRADFVKRQYPRTFALMKLIRETFDPKGLLNPGVKIA